MRAQSWGLLSASFRASRPVIHRPRGLWKVSYPPPLRRVAHSGYSSTMGHRNSWPPGSNQRSTNSASGAAAHSPAMPPRTTTRTRSPGSTVLGSESPSIPAPASAKRTEWAGRSPQCSTSSTPEAERALTRQGTTTTPVGPSGAVRAARGGGRTRELSRKGFMRAAYAAHQTWNPRGSVIQNPVLIGCLTCVTVPMLPKTSL